MGQPADFLRILFGDRFPPDLRAALWDKAGGKRSIYITEPDDADALQGRPDIYVSASLVGAGVTSEKVRVKTRDSAGIGGLWLDVDLPGPEDPPTKRPAPDRDTGLRLINAVLEPTVIVHSGYGLQAWWLFEDP